MSGNSEKLIRVGIECESIENDHYGIARVVRKLLEQLAARPQLVHTHRFILYFKKKIPHEPFLDSPVFVKKVTRPAWAPTSFNLHYHVWLLLRAYRDGLDCMYFPSYMLPLLWFKKSLVMLTDDVWYEIRNPHLPFRYRLAYRLFATWAAWRATRLMAISEASAAEVSRLFHVARDRIVSNPLAVDAPHLVRDMTRTQPYILFVGQAFPRRSLRETLLAFETIAPRHPNLQFVCVGPDKYTPPVKEKLIADINARLERQAVITFEHVSDEELATLYAHATTLVYVSSREGFGLPPLEALSYGTPPLVADTPVNREIYGTHAFFVQPPLTVDAIASALTRALSDTQTREAIRAAAPGILSRYTWQAHADRFLNIISAL